MRKHPIKHLILIFGFFVFLGGTFVLFWVTPDRTFSEDENRALQTLPVFSFDRLRDGAYTGRWNDYVSDQTPGRSVWVGVHGLCEQIRTGGESNGVLATAPEGDVQLAVRRFKVGGAADTDLLPDTHVTTQLSAINALFETLSRKGISLCVCLPPRTLDVTVADFEGYPADGVDDLTDCIQNVLDHDVNFVPLLPRLRALHEQGVPVYYRTDHHWTTQGAYEAYLGLFPSLGLEGQPLSASDFTVSTVPGFFGTTGSRAGLFGIEPDTLELWKRADDSRFAVQDENGQLLMNGFFDTSYLSKKDKYSVFLGGNHRLVTVTDTAAEEDRPRLLVVKDSFANSLVPFLARHADLVVVNLSAGMTDVSALCEEFDCDGVLLVWNRENLLTSDALGKVN